ncbi:MAG TPA: NAD(P)/FAD-dependent oxidoreductase [Roseovarius sp.]
MPFVNDVKSLPPSQTLEPRPHPLAGLRLRPSGSLPRPRATCVASARNPLLSRQTVSQPNAGRPEQSGRPIAKSSLRNGRQSSTIRGILENNRFRHRSTDGTVKMDKVECAVIGAGVIGLAIARRLARAGKDVLIIERADAIGTETSSRNSEVIHAGIYYAPGSLKAHLCVEGRALLYSYARKRAVPHRQCGKLIVATSPAQVARLEEIRQQAAACGVCDLRLVDAAQVAALEPELRCNAALMSPSTGIIDSHALMLALLGDAEAEGAVLSLNSQVLSVKSAGKEFDIITQDRGSGEEFSLRAGQIINAAGLRASELASRIEGLDPEHVPKTYFARGSYFTLPGRPRFSHLVYPVPEPGGLGVHLTLDLAGSMRFGPDVEWIETPEYTVNASRQAAFAQKIKAYWPGLPADDLHPGYCGIRPKLSGPGAPTQDFRIDTAARHGVTGLVNLFGIESPGLTASLAIADLVARGL